MTRATRDAHELAQFESALREGWTEATLAELVVHALGGEWGAAPEEAARRGWTRVSVLRGTEFRDWNRARGATAAERAIKPSSLARRQLRAGDIVVEISGGGPDQPVGRTLRVDDEALRAARNPLVCSNFCRQIRVHPDVDPAYVELGLRYQYGLGAFNDFQSQTTNLRNLDFQAFLAGVVLPLPPLAEQRRIVARAEELLARVELVRRRLDALPSVLRRFRQAVLGAAFSGRLTERWRERRPGLRPVATARDSEWHSEFQVPAPLEAPETPEGWRLVALQDLVSRVQYGTSEKADGDAKTGVPVLRMANIQDGRVDLSSLKYMNRRDLDVDTFRLAEGDVLFNRTNSPGLVGKAAVFEGGPEAVFASYLVRVACDPERVLGRFLCAWINSPWGRQWARAVRTDCVSQSNINTSKLRRMPVPAPPLEEQREIVQRIEGLFRLAAGIESRIALARARADRLAQAALDRAFRGELVPSEAELARAEGRAYEPGWELLDRIRIERQRSSRPARSRPERLAVLPAAAGARVKVKTTAASGASGRAAAPKGRTGTPKGRTVTPVYDPDQVLVAFRQACWGAGAVSEDELLRRVADRLGIHRLGKAARTRLQKHLETAEERRIVARQDGLLEGATPTFARYDEEFLLQTLRALMRTGAEYERGAVIRMVASYLGYGQVTAAVRNRMEVIFAAGVRRGLLAQRDGKVWRRS